MGYFAELIMPQYLVYARYCAAQAQLASKAASAAASKTSISLL